MTSSEPPSSGQRAGHVDSEPPTTAARCPRGRLAVQCTVDDGGSLLVTAVDTERLGRSQRRHRRPTGTPTPVAERRCTGQRAAVVDADQRGSAACVHAPVVDDLWTAAGSDELVEASSVDLAVEVHAIVERGRHNLPTVPRRDALSVSTDC